MKSFKCILAIFALCMIIAIPQASFAQKKASMCLKSDDSLITKRKCGKLDVYRPADNACGACGRDMTGEWTYTYHNNMNVSSDTETITFTQEGGTFTGTNESHTIIGKIEGDWVRLTRTVSGEEGLGTVLLAEGALMDFESGFVLGPLAVVADTFGNGGSLILRKPTS